LDSVVSGARVGVRENEKVAKLPIVRRQKNWEAWLKENLRVERIQDSNRVRVSFMDGNAEEQAAIINVVVEYYLKNDVGHRQDSEKRILQRLRDKLDPMRHGKKLTAEQAAKVEEGIKKREEYLKTLPALIEPAKAR
jgi:uncharacterized protein involved in exopolysaccharide biosynthesis